MTQFFVSAVAASAKRLRSATLGALVALAILGIGQTAQLHAAPPGDGQGPNYYSYTTGMLPSNGHYAFGVQYLAYDPNGVPTWYHVQGSPVDPMSEQAIPGQPGFSGYTGAVSGLYSQTNYRYYVKNVDTGQLVGGYGNIYFP